MRGLMLVVLLLFASCSLWVGYGAISQYRAVRVFVLALSAGDKGDIDTAIAETTRAIALDGQDVYYRALAELNLSSLERSNSVNQNDTKALQENFILLYNRAIASAGKAVSFDPTNYFNHLTLASVYARVVNLKIAGAYEQAKLAYDKASKLNPTNPFIPLSLARLEVANGTPKDAVSYLGAAITLKQNYAPAIFQLGYLYYQNGDYNLAIQQFEELLVLNPGNAEITTILSNLRAGLSPI